MITFYLKDGTKMTISNHQNRSITEIQTLLIELYGHRFDRIIEEENA